MSDETILEEFFTIDELERTAIELSYMMEHPDEYNSYENMEELKKALLSDD